MTDGLVEGDGEKGKEKLEEIKRETNIVRKTRRTEQIREMTCSSVTLSPELPLSS